MIRSLTLALLSAAIAAPALSQTPCFNTSLGTNLALGDDDTAQGLSLGFPFTYDGVAYTQICVCSNGYIWLGATSVAGGDFSPTEAELRNGAPRICPLWSDYNPAAQGSGQIYFDNSTPGFARITWAGVFAYGSTIPNDMQVTLDASSNITVSYGTITAPGSGGSVIIGASAGGGATTTSASFATRPTFIPSNNFAEELLLNGNAPMPYGNARIQWTSAGSGYAITDVACVPTQLPHPARAATFGSGCPSGSPSLYELFGPVFAADLSGRTLTFAPAGSLNYAVTQGASSAWFSGFSNVLPLGDDQTAPVNLPFAFPWNGIQINRIQVCSNGFLTLGNANPGAPFNPSVTAMLSGPARMSGFWGDLNPPASSAGGGVFADVDAATGDFVVTWNAVPEYGTTNFNSFQIALRPTGGFAIRWQAVQATANLFLAGYSRGGGSPLTPPTDISEVTTSSVSNVIQNPMTLAPAAASLPSVGATFTQDAGGIPAFPNGVVSILFTGVEAVTPVPLGGAGLPGCTAYLQVPELFSTLQLTLGVPTTSFSYSIPNDPLLIGAEFVSQAITDDVAANAFGFRVSNGVRWMIGL
jgi:hypothetical protein